MTDHLTTEDALIIAEAMALVVRDPGPLASAVARHAASAFGADAWATLPRKTAALIDGVNRNHPLVDGNKRLSWVCAVVFAGLNGATLAAPQSEIYEVVTRVAADGISLDQLADWVEQHLAPRANA